MNWYLKAGESGWWNAKKDCRTGLRFLWLSFFEMNIKYTVFICGFGPFSHDGARELDYMVKGKRSQVGVPSLFFFPIAGDLQGIWIDQVSGYF